MVICAYYIGIFHGCFSILRFWFFLVGLSVLLSGCKPDEILVNIYSSDVSAVSDGEIVQVPLIAKVTLLGDDDGNTLKNAVELTKKFVHPETRFIRSKTEYSEVLVVETLIPMGTLPQLDRFFAKNISLAYLEVKKNQGGDYFDVTFFGASHIEDFNRAIQGINPIDRVSGRSIFVFLCI